MTTCKNVWRKIAYSVTVIGLLIAVHQDVAAQIERKRAEPARLMEEVFLTPRVVIGGSVQQLNAGNMNFTILHVFGRVDGGVQSLWGLDDSANIRFGIDYGISDRLSVGAGRSRYDKLYDFRGQWLAVRQTKDGRIPVSVSVVGDVGITTEANGYKFIDRLNYYSSLLVARSMSSKLSIQMSAMMSHFNTVISEVIDGDAVYTEENTHVAVGFSIRYLISERVSVLAEYMPVIGPRSTGTADAAAIAVNFETGGHVFQLYLKTSQWLTEQHVIARNTESLLSGDIRAGFVVNRVF